MSSTNRGSDRGTAAHPNDLFQTPTCALMPLLKSGVVKLDGIVWECSAGRGAMVRTLIEHGVPPDRIGASDIAGCIRYIPRNVVGINLGHLDLTDVEPGFGSLLRVRLVGDAGLTVLTNPAYRVPYASRVCGLEGEDLAWKIPKMKRTRDKVTKEWHSWRDGVAMTFVAADNAGADQIVLGPIRTSWWHGATKTRGRLRRWILKHYDVRLMTLGWRPRFLDVEGKPAGSGSDSCEYGYLVADRRAQPLESVAGVGALAIELEA